MRKPLLLGIEIGGTKLQVAVAHQPGEILAIERRAAQPSAGALGIWAEITSAVSSLLAEVSARPEDVAAVGIGFGGPVDASRGVVVRSHQVAGWEGVSLVDWTQRDLGVRLVAVENDADAAALAEARLGAGAGASPTLYVNSGSGVGGGLIVDGKIYRGGFGIGALEIGHLRIFPEDSGPEPAGSSESLTRDGCFRFATLEQAASGWAIAQAGARFVESLRLSGASGSSLLYDLSEGQPDRVQAELVAQAALGGDPDARRILDRATTALAQALAHAVTLLAPRRIMLGGGVSLMDRSLWLDSVRAKLDQRVFEPFRGAYQVVAASLGEHVVVHGALIQADDVRRSRTNDQETAIGRRDLLH